MPHPPSWERLKPGRAQKGRRARFLQTQMVMQPEALKRFCWRDRRTTGLPVLAGVFLLKSARIACEPECARRTDSPALIDRLAAAEDPAAEGIQTSPPNRWQPINSNRQGWHLMAVKRKSESR